MDENQNIEFKESWRDEHLKVISSFANSYGGTLFIGIMDSGKVIGVRNIQKLLEDLPNKIINRLGIFAEVNKVSTDNIDYISIIIACSDYPISYDGKYYKRTGSTTQELKGVDLQNFLLTKSGKSWDSQIINATIDDLDIDTIEQFKKMSKERLPTIYQSNNIKVILQNLNLMSDDNLTNAAILLFGKQPQKFAINSMLRVGRFKNQIDIIDTVIIEGNLFQQIIIASDAIKKHLNVRFEIKDNQRNDIWDYPLASLREALMNCLIHRDYQIMADSQIRIYDDRIWFYNPGMLPFPMTIEKIRIEHASFPRNKLLAMVFYYAGFIEKWGSGTLRIINLCKEQNLPEPEFKEEMGGFNVVFFNTQFSENILANLGLNDRQLNAINFIKTKSRITNREYQTINKCGRNTASTELQEMVNLKILKSSGKKGAGSFYIIAH